MDDRPELFELLEEVVKFGGWVEPDVAWPELLAAQMKICIKENQLDLAKSMSRDFVTKISGNTSQDTVQLYRF